jgi:enamine deaminase RidA (YjgF/YER057c/UK114 family)
MSASGAAVIGAPMANYAAARRVGDFVFMSGVVAVDPARRRAVEAYDDLPDAARAALRTLGYDTGQMSVDVHEAPAVAQSWFVLERIRRLAEEAGGGMDDVVKLVQYFRDLRHYPAYNRVRGLFYPAAPPVSTVVEVSRFLPGDALWIEVEATMYLPR